MTHQVLTLVRPTATTRRAAPSLAPVSRTRELDGRGHSVALAVALRYLATQRALRRACIASDAED